MNFFGFISRVDISQRVKAKSVRLVRSDKTGLSNIEWIPDCTEAKVLTQDKNVTFHYKGWVKTV